MRGWKGLKKRPISLRKIKFYFFAFTFLSGKVAISEMSVTSLKSSSSSLLFSIDQYLNTSENNSDQNIYYNANNTLNVSEGQQLTYDFNLNWTQNENYLYAHVEDFYYSIQSFGNPLNIGFKKVNWAENLDYFQSPEWQQQLERNRLHPRTGGNLGLFYGFNFQNLKFDIQYSPFFIPTRGPDIQFENGRAVTESPWMIAPPDEVPYEGDNFPTRYSLENPDLSKFLREQSIAVRVLAYEGNDWILNLGYANKPSPKYVTDLDFQANISDPDVPIDISIRPRVVRHQLISSELTYKVSQNSKFTLGYMNENFDRESLISESQTFMQPLNQNVVSLIFSKKTERYSFGIGGIYRNGGRTDAIGELASALVNQNLNYIYEQAIKLDFTYFKTWGWTINTSVSYDFLQKGLLTSASLQRTFSNALLNIGFDALEPINATDEASFIYQYRNLDRVWAGVSYVF